MSARTLFLRPQCVRIAPALPLRPTAASLVPRGYSTFVDPRENGQADEVDFDASAMHGSDVQPVQADAVDIGLEHALPEGAKYPLPTLPLPPSAVMGKRYPTVLEQVTNLIMRDGKKATAQSVMTEVLAILRTKSAPKPSARANIIPTAPPLESLPSNPIAYLQTAVDSVGPLVTLKSVKGSGGFRETVPSPLRLRQRRRKAITWIIEAADKKQARLSLAERLAEEIVAVVEGRSTAWDKRMQVHKTAVASRANVKVKVM